MEERELRSVSDGARFERWRMVVEKKQHALSSCRQYAINSARDQRVARFDRMNRCAKRTKPGMVVGRSKRRS
jgi:hypothetical protein